MYVGKNIKPILGPLELKMTHLNFMLLYYVLMSFKGNATDVDENVPQTLSVK